MSGVVFELDSDPRVVWIKLNEPKMNVLKLKLLIELREAILKAEKGENSAIILSSTSENFCAGADLSELKSLSFEEGLRWFEHYLEVVRLLRTSNKPVIAAVRGYCVAGGNELAMACDLVVASKNAKFGQPEVRVGSTAMGLGVQLLPLLVGEKRARELLLTGRIIDAEEALHMGLIILENCSSQAFMVIKSGLNFWTDFAMLYAQLARDMTAMVWASSEFKERCEEFLRKRKITPSKFKGVR